MQSERLTVPAAIIIIIILIADDITQCTNMPDYLSSPAPFNIRHFLRIIFVPQFAESCGVKRYKNGRVTIRAAANRCKVPYNAAIKIVKAFKAGGPKAVSELCFIKGRPVKTLPSEAI